MLPRFVPEALLLPCVATATPPPQCPARKSPPGPAGRRPPCAHTQMSSHTWQQLADHKCCRWASTAKRCRCIVDGICAGLSISTRIESQFAPANYVCSSFQKLAQVALLHQRVIASEQWHSMPHLTEQQCYFHMFQVHLLIRLDATWNESRRGNFCCSLVHGATMEDDVRSDGGSRVRAARRRRPAPHRLPLPHQLQR